MTRAQSTEEPCAAKVASTVLKTSGRSDPLTEFNQAVREYVVKLKISNGTRTEDGTKAWDVFLSVLGTCRKLGVNFYRYLLDRISNSYNMPSLAQLICQQAQSPPT